MRYIVRLAALFGVIIALTSLVYASPVIETWQLDSPSADHNSSIYDATLRERFPTTTYGSDSQIVLYGAENLGGGIYNRSTVVMWFNLSTLPANATVLQANLTLTFWSQSNWHSNISAHPLTRAFNESVVTWLTADGGAWTNPGGDYDTNQSYSELTDAETWGVGTYDVDVTNVIQRLYNGTNYGLVLVPDPQLPGDERRIHARSSDYSTVAERPMLTVKYDTNYTATPPSVDNVTINPDNATTLTDLNVSYSYSGEFPESGTTFQWYLNGSAISGATGTSLYHGNFSKSDIVTIEVTPYDGMLYGDSVNATATINNIPPKAYNVTISPLSAYTNQTLAGQYVYYDIDGDVESGSVYKWYEVLDNGTLVDTGYTNQTLLAGNTNKTTYRFEVTPSDGTNYGLTTSVRSNSTWERYVFDDGLHFFAGAKNAPPVPEVGDNFQYSLTGTRTSGFTPPAYYSTLFNQYIALPTGDSLEPTDVDWTFAFWFRSAVGEGSDRQVVGFNGSGNFYLTRYNGTGALQLLLSDGTPSHNVTVNTSAILPSAGDFNYLAFTINETSHTFYFYYNGVEEASVDITGWDSIWDNSSALYLIGDTYIGGATTHIGDLDDIAVWNRTLSASEIAIIADNKSRNINDTFYDDVQILNTAPVILNWTLGFTRRNSNEQTYEVGPDATGQNAVVPYYFDADDDPCNGVVDGLKYQYSANNISWNDANSYLSNCNHYTADAYSDAQHAKGNYIRVGAVFSDGDGGSTGVQYSPSWIVSNTPPEGTDGSVATNGTHAIVSYAYSDFDLDPESGSLYSWYAYPSGDVDSNNPTTSGFGGPGTIGSNGDAVDGNLSSSVTKYYVATGGLTVTDSWDYDSGWSNDLSACAVVSRRTSSSLVKFTFYAYNYTSAGYQQLAVYEGNDSVFRTDDEQVVMCFPVSNFISTNDPMEFRTRMELLGGNSNYRVTMYEQFLTDGNASYVVANDTANNQSIDTFDNLDVVFTSVVPSDGDDNGTRFNTGAFYAVLGPLLSDVTCNALTYPVEYDEPSPAVIQVNFTVLVPQTFVTESSTVTLSLDGDYYAAACGYSVVSSSERDYICNVTMHYWYGAGDYDRNVTYVNDGLTAVDLGSAACTYGQLVASQRMTNTVGFSDAAPGLEDVQSDNAVVILNTGNVPINLSMVAYNLSGVKLPSAELDAADFKVGSTLGTSVQLQHGVEKNLSITISPGDESDADVWLWLSMPSDQVLQDYVTITSWQVISTG
jgi:Concanavalin A-like lectin/glucanases superfamily